MRIPVLCRNFKKSFKKLKSIDKYIILCYFVSSRTEKFILFSKISEENYRTNTYVVVVISKDRLSVKTLIFN